MKPAAPGSGAFPEAILPAPVPVGSWTLGAPYSGDCVAVGGGGTSA